MAQQAVFTVLERGVNFAVDEAKYLSSVSDKLEVAKKRLLRMQAFLRDLDDKMLKGGAMARNLVSEVREVAYEVEDIIDTANILKRQSDPKITITGAISKYACFPISLTHLHKLGARIDSATEWMKTIFEDFERHNIAPIESAEPSWYYITEDDTIQWRLVPPMLDEQVDVIGFDDQIEQIKDGLLDRGSNYLTVVSIVGPGGAGKSTLAKKVYGLTVVKRHFDIHAWIAVSQRPVHRRILEDLIGKHVPDDFFKKNIKKVTGNEKIKDLKKLTDYEVKMLLGNFLATKRYLIVLDDVWNTDDWDIIREAFPDNKNSSRVILTTRKEDVARHPNARKKIIKPKLLNKEQRTQLLLSIALPEYNPVDSPVAKGQSLDELKKLGQDLAVKCRGLPLAIVVLGGYLSKNLDFAEWKKLTVDTNWHNMIGYEKVIRAVLDLSYYDMPSHLRYCFMYTTTFPEDYHIDVKVLARLWVAEGFIPLVRGHTREDIAVKYTAELVRRCMIQVEERASSGRIKVVKVHDILRDWGIRRARTEGLIKDCNQVKEIEEVYSEEMIQANRLVLHGFLAREAGSSKRQLRTLLAFNFHGVQVRKAFHNLHHLRVLYLNSSDKNGCVYLPREIGRMRYLRYLGLGGNCLYSLPSSIGNLLSLEIMYATANVDHIPCSFWQIETLRQVHVHHARVLSVPRISSQSKVNSLLLSLTTSSHANNSEAKRVMTATKRQLSEDKHPDLSYCFMLTYMAPGTNQMDIVGRCTGEHQLPSDLPVLDEAHKMWVLKVCGSNLLSSDNMIEIGRMRNLKVLELGQGSYTGLVMTYPPGSFPRLHQLLLHDLAMEEWEIGSRSMTNLMELKLCKCLNLKKLPEGLLWLKKFRKLDLIEMPPDFYHMDRIAQELDKRFLTHVYVSSDEKKFQHLELPISHTKNPWL